MLQAFDDRFPETERNLCDNVVNGCIASPLSFLDLRDRAEHIVVGVSIQLVPVGRFRRVGQVRSRLEHPLKAVGSAVILRQASMQGIAQADFKVAEDWQECRTYRLRPCVASK